MIIQFAFQKVIADLHEGWGGGRRKEAEPSVLVVRPALPKHKGDLACGHHGKQTNLHLYLR